MIVRMCVGSARTLIFGSNLKILCALMVVVTLIFVLFAMNFNPYLNNTVLTMQLPNHSSDDQIKYVLYWTPFWNVEDFDMGFGKKPFENCEYKNCYATNNRTLVPAERFDALIFHASVFTEKKHGVPSTRRPNQMYIYVNMEAPTTINTSMQEYKSFFNWTMTYRFDSDLVKRHGAVVKQETDYTMPSPDFLRNKTKMAAWFVSHCDTSGKRELLVKEIQKYIPVDVYGGCGKLTCDKRNDSPRQSSPKCYDMVAKKYKFYFSFENSYCRDYSTEKLYNVLQKNIVPVVYGAGDYKLSAPPKSVINVADFSSAKKFAEYLKHLDRSVDEYSKFFEWKKHYRIWSTPLACDLCKKLHEPIRESIYADIDGWWWQQNKKSICKSGKALPIIVRKLLVE